MGHDFEVVFGILNGNVVVEHGKWVVGIEKSMVVLVGKGKERHFISTRMKTKLELVKSKKKTSIKIARKFCNP